MSTTTPSPPGPRVALVGYGSAGRGIHAPLLAACGVPPAVIVTAHPERVAQAAAEQPTARMVPDLDAALALAPDLVVLASPSGVHAVQAEACLAAGVPVVVDKPLGVDAAQAARIVAAASVARTALTVFQNRRWDTEQLTLAGLLAEGTLGPVHRFERRWERWRPEPRDRWRETAPAAEGGGILLDLHTHLVDGAVQLFGPVRSVSADIRAITTPAEDDAVLFLRHAGGVSSVLTASSIAAVPGPRTRVLGRRAGYLVTRFETDPTAFTGAEDPAGHCGWLVTGQERSPVPAAPGGHADFYRATFAALAQQDPAERQAAMPVAPADAVHVLEVIDAARIAAARGETVTLDVGGDGLVRSPGIRSVT